MPKTPRTPGPASPTRNVEAFTGAIPAPMTDADGDVALVQLGADELRARLLARERDIKFRVEALQHEAGLLLDDVNVGGRPLVDIIRGDTPRALGVAGAVGAAVGLLLGLRARAKRRPDADDEIDFVRARLAVALDDAAERVARGEDVDEALRRSMDAVPALYGDASQLRPRPRSTRRQALDVAVTTAIGFGTKVLLDQITKRYTPHEETLSALADAADD